MKAKSQPSASQPTQKPQTPKSQEEQVVRVSQAAKLKGVSRAAIYDAIKRGDLHTVAAKTAKSADPSAPLTSSPSKFVEVTLADLLAWTPLGHKHGRPAGVPMTEAAKANISHGQKRRWTQRKGQTITQGKQDR